MRLGPLFVLVVCSLAGCDDPTPAAPTPTAVEPAPIQPSPAPSPDPVVASPVVQNPPCPEPRPRTDTRRTLRGRLLDVSDGPPGTGLAETDVELIALGRSPDRTTPCRTVAATAVTDAHGRFEMESADFASLSSCERASLPYVFDHFVVGGPLARTFDFAAVDDLADIEIRVGPTRRVELEVRCASAEAGPPTAQAHQLPSGDRYASVTLEPDGEPGTYHASLTLPVGDVQITTGGPCGIAVSALEVAAGETPMLVSLVAPATDIGALRVDVPAPNGAERHSVRLMRGPAHIQTFGSGVTLLERLPPGEYTLTPTIHEQRARCRSSVRVETGQTTEVSPSGCVIHRAR